MCVPGSAEEQRSLDRVYRLGKFRKVFSSVPTKFRKLKNTALFFSSDHQFTNNAAIHQPKFFFF